tara:strand:+ start:82 stop:357 length:276 start_codon:yes stop_codon:yes gene_type:complete
MATTTFVSFFDLLIPIELVIYCVYYKKIGFSIMHLDLEPGDYVINPSSKHWGIGQIQSIINNKVTVNFENSGKQVLNIDIISLEKIKNEQK